MDYLTDFLFFNLFHNQLNDSQFIFIFIFF